MTPSSSEHDSRAPRGGDRECPTCHRTVEAGFKFCDWCGTPLDDKTSAPTKEEDVKPQVTEAKRPEDKEDKTPRRKLWERRKKKPDEPVPVLAQAPAAATSPGAETAVEPAPAQEKRRLWPRRAKEETEEVPHIETTTLPRSEFPARPSAPLPTTPLPVAVGETTEVVRPELVEGLPRERRPLAATGAGLFTLHVIFAFLAGVLVLAVITLIVTRLTQGRTAFLEIRGLPAFIGVATSVGVFAMLRDKTVVGGGATARGRISAAVGLIVLVVAGALLYRPVVLTDAQKSAERLLGVWSDAETEAVEAYESDLSNWNVVLAGYQRSVAAVFDGTTTIEAFQNDANTAHNELAGAVASMKTHASQATNAELVDALDDLAGIYEGELSGIRQASRGTVDRDFAVLEAGSELFKTRKQSALDLFGDRLRPLLERAGVDADEFETLLVGPTPPASAPGGRAFPPASPAAPSTGAPLVTGTVSGR